ncbi:MAG: DUF4344 domain-containing metallopeptidase [Parvibaculaceae bacterium]
MIKKPFWIGAHLLSLALVIAVSFPVAAKVNIAREQVVPVPMPPQVLVPAGKFVSLPIPLRASALLKVEALVLNKTFNDVSVWVCSQAELQYFAQGRDGTCRGVPKAKGSIRFDYPASGVGAPYFLILDNRYSLFAEKRVAPSVAAQIQMSQEDVEGFQRSFGGILEGILKIFDVPPFDVSLKPCGQENAFSEGSNGDITICSELLFSYITQRHSGAAKAVFFHELGHTLLNLWGMPNWNNEQTADEFATVMLIWMNDKKSIQDWVANFAEQDSAAEAIKQLHSDDTHPLSIQRARNVTTILDNPAPTVARWNKLIYPHLKIEALRRIAEHHGPYDQPALAEKELATRRYSSQR